MIRWDCQKGFTLAELLVAFAVLALVLASVVTVQQSGLLAYVTGSNRVEAQQNVRAALDRMVREIREAQSLTSPNATTLTLRYDWNGNGVIGEAGVAVCVDVPCPPEPQRGEQVTYRLTGTALERQESGVDATFLTVIGGVAQLTFGFPTATSVSIIIRSGTDENVPAGSAADTQTQIQTIVRLRNS
jgi:prepilin-type N-terminal cleavage/methylation domain-containing protein